MKKSDCLYSGKAKTVFKTDNPDYLILQFRDDTSAFNGVKLAKLEGKGKINNQFNAFIMQKLEENGIPTHFKQVLSDDESLVLALEMLPVECVIRNKVAGSLAKRLGLEEGLPLSSPIFEFFLKNDVLNDPFINEYHIREFHWATDDEIAMMKRLSFQINDILKNLFEAQGLWLVDFKLEFGRFQNKLVLGDEITPDGCRIWDAKSLEKLDKDRFRRDLGNVVESYKTVAVRLRAEI